MYAYVKFVSGRYKDKKTIVATSAIKSFNQEKHKKVIKYQVKYEANFHSAIILFLADSKEDIKKMIATKRESVVPEHLLLSASEGSEENELKTRSVSTIQNNSTLNNILSVKLKKYETDLELLKASNRTKEEKSSNTKNFFKESTSQNTEKKCTSEDDQEIKENSDIDMDTEYSPPPSKVPKLLFHEKVEENHLIHKLIDQNLKLKKKSQHECEINKLKSDIVVLKKENKELKAEIDKLKSSKYEIKNQLKEKSEKLEKLQNLNMDLQVTIIEKTKERDVMIQNLASNKENLKYQDNYPAIGTLRTTDNLRRVHIGRNEWINENQYNCLLNCSKTPRQCASNILTLVFDEEILLSSTKTGFESNKKRQGKKPCPKLDEIKFGACEDFYIYWMKQIYKPKNDEKKNYLTELTKFDFYASKKIADLKRTPRQNKKSLEKSSKESPIDCNENEENRKSEERIEINSTTKTNLAKTNSLAKSNNSDETNSPAKTNSSISSTEKYSDNEDLNDSLLSSGSEA